MAELIQLVCAECKKSYRLRKLIPGRVPPCKACKHPLRLPAKAVLHCAACNVFSDAREIDLQKAENCNLCQEAMAVARTVVESEDATMVLAPSKASEAAGKAGSHDDLALQPLDSAAGAIQAKRFGKYEIIRELARGGMGIVYLVRDPRLRRTLALKVLLAGEGASEESIRRFLREARAAACLPNPHVISIHEVGEVSGQFYFTMDYVDGVDLGQAIDDGTYSQRELLRCLVDVCGALHDAHQKGIIHRDLKPQNILIDPDKQAFVTDFGLAKDVTSQSIQSMSGTVLGTPAYMSPEQAQGRTREISERSDIYSMGVILYEVVTRQRPFEGATVFDTIDAVINKEPIAPREIDPDLGLDLNTVILKCIEKDPARRYRSMRELKADLKRYLSGKAVAARPLTRKEKWARRIRKRPGVMIGLVAAPVLVLTVALTWWLVSGQGFWREIEAAIASADSAQMAAGLTMLEQRFKSGTLDGVDSEKRALSLAEKVLGGPSKEAEGIALRMIVFAKDTSSAEAVAAVVADDSLEASRRIEAAHTLARLGAPGKRGLTSVTGAVSGALRNPKTPPALRSAIVSVLQNHWSRDARDLLVSVFRNTENPTALRVAAMEAVAPRAVVTGPEMAALLQCLADEEDAVASAADRILAVIRSQANIAVLYGYQSKTASAIAAVGDLQQSHNRRQQQMLNLLNEMDGPRHKEKKRTPVQEMAAKLKSAVPAERLAAAYDLGRHGEPDALSPLVERLEDAEAAVRRAAARGIVALVARHPKARVATSTLERLFADKRPGVRLNAVWLAGHLEAKACVPALLGMMESSPEKALGRILLQALGRIGDESALEPLAACYSSAVDRDTRRWAVESLGRFGKKAVPHLVAGLQDRSKQVREQTQRVLATITGVDLGADPQGWLDWLDE